MKTIRETEFIYLFLGTIQVLRHQRGRWGGQMMMFDDKVGGGG